MTSLEQLAMDQIKHKIADIRQLSEWNSQQDTEEQERAWKYAKTTIRHNVEAIDKLIKAIEDNNQ